MFEFISGEIVELTPTSAVIQNNKIGYFINISLNTFSLIQNKKEISLFIHQVIREDAHLLFGFSTKEEREIFRYLISVSGIGANTARMMLSSLNPFEIQTAILQNNVAALQNIKGIGAKTAQRVIIELKDKLSKSENISEIFPTIDNTIKDESLSALVALGFSRSSVQKVLNKIFSNQNDLSLEEVIKQALKLL